MATLPFMHWYPADYAGDTTHLTRDQDGGYRLLIDACWLRGGKLPDDDRQLALITKCTSLDEWRALREILAPFFMISGGFWSQKRLTREHRKAQHLHDVRSKAGSKGVAKRWQGYSKSITRARVPEPDSEASSLRSEGTSSSSFHSEEEWPPGGVNGFLKKGVSLLGKGRSGVIRQMIREHGKDRVNDALAALGRNHPDNPVAYFVTCCKDPPEPEPPTRGYDGPKGPPPRPEDLWPRKEP